MEENNKALYFYQIDYFLVLITNSYLDHFAFASEISYS